MGCGGSKEDVTTGNTTANGAGRGGKLFQRKSTVSANQRSSCASSSDDTSIVIKDVVKEPSSGEPKADEVNMISAERLIPVVEEKKEEEEVVKKDVADDAAATVTEAVAVTEQPPMEAEEQLPKSTMTDEAVVEEEAKVDEAVVHKEETSPAPPTNEDGESVGQSIAEHMEANPVDEHNKAVEAAAVSESSPEKKNGDGQTATAPSESPAAN